jgi:hypothetical protein
MEEPPVIDPEPTTRKAAAIVFADHVGGCDLMRCAESLGAQSRLDFLMPSHESQDVLLDLLDGRHY